MGDYLGYRISIGKLDYTEVVTKYPQYKVDIDSYLTERGQEKLIVQ